MEFKKEVFEGEGYNSFKILFQKIRSILRQLDIYNDQDELVVKIISKGWFFGSKEKLLNHQNK